MVRGYGIYDSAGRLHHVGIHRDEQSAWTIYLGWPSDEEIEQNKRQGFRCIPVIITPAEHADAAPSPR